MYVGIRRLICFVNDASRGAFLEDLQGVGLIVCTFGPFERREGFSSCCLGPNNRGLGWQWHRDGEPDGIAPR